MNDGQCSGEIVDEEGSSSSLNDLPDELLILIFNRLMDLKCLCFCSLVSPRFSSLVFQVHSVHFPLPRRTTTTTDAIPTPDDPATDSLVRKTFRYFFNGIVAKPLQYFRQFKSIRSMLFTNHFLSKFKSLRSFHLLHPSSPHSQNPNDDSIYRWAAKLVPTIDTLVFLSTSSIRVGGGEIDFDEQEPNPLWLNELMRRRAGLTVDCLQDAIIWHRALRDFVREHPLLENITITDSKKQGGLSLRDSKVVDMRNWLNSASQSGDEVGTVIIHHLHLPVLKLPASRKVMVSPTLLLLEMVERRHKRRDWCGEAAEIATLFSEQGEDEFAEAVVEMMVNNSSWMEIIYTRGV